jgi:hypothetical protein
MNRQELIRKIVVDMALPQKTVEAIVSHQFQSVVNALRNNNSVEVSGFGRLVFKPKQARRQLEGAYLRLELCEGDMTKEGVKKDRMRGYKIRHQILEEKIEALKILLHEN